MGNYPIVVVEGPDGSGKTTLANKLIEEYGFSYRHLTYRFKDKMDFYNWAALELCLRDAEQGPVILDRWWPSELVYADAFRGGSKYPMWARMLDRVALKHGVTYVWCLPSDEDAYFKRFDKLKASGREMYETMQGVYQGYITMFGELRSRLDMCYYDIDTHGQDLDGYCQWLIDLTEQVGGGIPYFCENRLDRRFAGNPVNPHILFVGDESNSKFRREVWPFFEHGNSSLWVTSALQQVGIHESDVAWVNAFHRGKLQDRFLNDVYAAVGQPEVVALGQNAALALIKSGIPHTQLKHPQWSRRFAPKDLREYRDLNRFT